jgi:hypothetical protein
MRHKNYWQNEKYISCCNMNDRTLVQTGNMETEGIVDGSRKGNIHPKHIE